MNLNPVIYVAMMSALLNAGCADKALLDDDTRADSNVLTFSAIAGAAADDVARSDEKEIFEPLELSDDESSATLYLHTYESERIGYDPAAIEVSNGSRAAQVDSPDALIKFHGNFKAHATLLETGADYIAWTDTRCKGSDNVEKNIWLPRRTEYWPAEQTLAFHAVSPAAELPNLKYLIAGENALTFSYSAQKGGDNADAVAQPDLLVATSVCNKATSDHGRAPLKFHHALSAVKFAIRDVLAGEIVNIRIAGVRSTGTCSYTFDQTTGLGNLLWSDQEGSESFSQRFNYAVDDRGIIDPSDESKDIVLNDKMPEKTFMMIPQQIPDDAEIIVTLKRAGMTPEEITVRGKIKANNVKEWKPGHEYVYTISTSKDNWVYVFQAFGNHDSKNGGHADVKNPSLDGDQIYVYSPNSKDHDIYRDNAYFKVKSYRYRANEPSYIEMLPWSAVHDGAEGMEVDADGKVLGSAGDRYRLTASQWICDSIGLKGKGSISFDVHALTFAPHMDKTTWKGDEWMQERSVRGTKDSPWDLSTCNRKDIKSRYTANCYVIDCGGWYMLPVVYGNAVSGGQHNDASYTFKGVKATNLNTYKSTSSKVMVNTYLDVLTDYAGNKIVQSYIPETHYKSAGLVWSDVYNGISDVELVDGNQVNAIDNNKYIRFYVSSQNMQQGNSLLAVYDKADSSAGDAKAIWSWHIWFTEHWLNPETGMPEALSSESFQFKSACGGSEWRERGDVKTGKNLGIQKYKYYISPYNVGWCDPKSVIYLHRSGIMRFTQYEPDGETVSKYTHTTTLGIVQQGEYIDYKYGNNVYYQFGRKDPFIGFVDNLGQQKRSFGPHQYIRGNNPSSISNGIINPHVMYCSGSETNDDVTGWPLNDWIGNFYGYNNNYSTVYINLWNNGGSFTNDPTGDKGNYLQESLFTSIKTVYDPCPPGYMVPPAAVWKVVGQSVNNTYNTLWFTDKSLPPTVEMKETKGITSYVISAASNIAPSLEMEQNKLWFTGTGHRWYGDYGGIAGGQNTNNTAVYLWTSTPSGRFDRSAFSLALGALGDTYGVCAFFYGRRSMARPVRAIREVYDH